MSTDQPILASPGHVAAMAGLADYVASLRVDDLEQQVEELRALVIYFMEPHISSWVRESDGTLVAYQCRCNACKRAHDLGLWVHKPLKITQSEAGDVPR